MSTLRPPQRALICTSAMEVSSHGQYRNPTGAGQVEPRISAMRLRRLQPHSCHIERQSEFVRSGNLQEVAAERPEGSKGPRRRGVNGNQEFLGIEPTGTKSPQGPNPG
ncbi:hypothetical protein NDU88_002448 [Pleurodeles waltl]|uniref:Uncharacterized protein n=1 Tax=Pleurodeles waltl TaxID=8319 RepID=A0AAV7M3Y9_PLEWA|nr:hypothetical protein NDU88_002448 [Pleurodeles waltl]